MTAAIRPGMPMAQQRERREVLTPEGVPISFELASVGDRASALLLDVAIVAGVLLALALLAGAAFGGRLSGDSWLQPLFIIGLFLIQNFYFAFFELRWQGWTPGKRIVGIRVIDSRGGPLEPSAILARNLVRELELWLPLRFVIMFLLFRNATWPDIPGWASLLAIVWLLIFLLLPLFNRDRLRAGDLIAGTWVVVQPKPVLLPDLAAAVEVIGPRTAAGVPAGPLHAFTDQQLGVYGEFELQVLEQALRGEPGPERLASLIAITNKIRTKLHYEPPVGELDVELFLNTYYTAVRASLERRRLFGKRKADKYS